MLSLLIEKGLPILEESPFIALFILFLLGMLVKANH
jgi:hypothetical protein